MFIFSGAFSQMQSTVEEINTVQRRLKIELDSNLVNEAFSSTYKKLQQNARIRGFRPGKAPLNIIKKMYAEKAASDVADQLIKEHLFNAIEKNEIKPISSPALEELVLPKQGEQYSFSAVIDVLPKLNISTYKGIKAECHKQEIDDKIVEQQIEQTQRSQAKKLAAAEDAVAAAGMMATISHSAKLSGEPYPPFEAQSVSVEVNKEGYTHPEIDKALTGMKAGESKAIQLTIPNHAAGEKDAKELTIDLELKLEKLEELKLPNLDDEFAKDLGFDSIDKFKDTVRDQLTTRAESQKKAEIESNILSAIIDANPFEVPPTLINSVIDDMIEAERWPDEKQKLQAKQDPELRKSLIERAKRKAQNSLILWHVANEEKLEVTDADIDNHILKMLPPMPESTEGEDNSKQQEMLEGMRKHFNQNLKDNLLFEKAAGFLVDHAEISERTP